MACLVETPAEQERSDAWRVRQAERGTADPGAGRGGHGADASRDVACSQAVTLRQPDIQRVLAA